MIWLSFAYKILKQEKRFSLLYVAILTLGLIGCIFIINLRVSTLGYLEKNLKKILTADLSINSRAPIPKEQLASLEASLGAFQEKTKKVNFFSMVQGKDIARIVRVQAISANFPLYGDFKISGKQIDNEQIHQELTKQDKIWMDTQTRQTLDLQTGDRVQIGDYPFVLGADITKAPLEAFGNTAIAPNVYISLENLEKTNLLQTGSRVNYRVYYKLPEQGLDIKQINKNLAQKAQILDTPQPIHIHSYLEANNNIASIIRYTVSFLGLISVATLFLASIGISYSFRSHFYRCLRTIGILMSFGTSNSKIYFVFFLQLFFLGLVGASSAILLSSALTATAFGIFVNYLPSDFVLVFSIESIILSLLLGVVCSLSFASPTLAVLHQIRPSLLFQKIPLRQFSFSKNIFYYLSYAIIFLLFLCFCIWFAGVINAFFFLLAITAVLLIEFLLGKTILLLLQKIETQWTQSLFWKLIFRNLYRKKVISLLFFSVLATNIFIANLIFQVQNNLQKEFQPSETLQIPDFFLFDIQPEQLKNLQNFLKQEGASLQNISPLIRAKLTSVNNNPVSTPTTETQEFSRRRGFNVSYRAKLSAAESIVAGKDFSNTPISEANPLVEVSLESDFAKEQKLKIGDKILFEVQTIPIQGKIINLRKVNWSSFQPNFYVLFQTGVLESAPQTFLASIPDIPDNQKASLQKKIIQNFSNISIIEVSKIINGLLELAKKVTWIILSLSGLFLLTAIVLTSFIIKSENQKKSWEISLLKHLGYSKKQLIFSNLTEFFLWGGIASICGLCLSYFSHYFIAKYLFDEVWQFSLGISLQVLFSAVVLLIVISSWSIYQLTQQKIIYLLRNG